MNIRNHGRSYFKICNLTYDEISMSDIYLLIQILNIRIGQANSCMLMVKEPKLKGKNRNIVIKNGKIEFAAIKVKGTYFESREAITFNRNGFIGFCAWADEQNSSIIVTAFMEWCTHLVARRLNEEIQKR